MSNGMIVVNNDGNRQTVLGRDLHEFLEVETRYNDWMSRLIENYDFMEGEDFLLVTQKRATNNPKKPWTTINDHQLTISTAKEISMEEAGRMCEYGFIEDLDFSTFLEESSGG